VKKRWAWALAAALCLAAAGTFVSIFVSHRLNRPRGERYVPQDVPDVLGVSTPSIQDAVAGRVAQPPPDWVSAERWARVRTLYRTYENAPLWLEPEGVKDRASALLDALAKAGAIDSNGMPDPAAIALMAQAGAAHPLAKASAPLSGGM